MTARRFAEGTTVSAEKSRIEIERLLANHGASQRQFATDDDAGRTVLTFRMHNRNAKISMSVNLASLPNPAYSDYNQPTKAETPRGWARWSAKQRKEWLSDTIEQMNRELMRRMLLVLKGKLELIVDGVTTFEREFLADLMLPDGSTVHEALEHRLAAAYDSGEMPPLLLPPASRR